MKKCLTKLLVLTAMITGTANANFTGIATGTFGMGGAGHPSVLCDLGFIAVYDLIPEWLGVGGIASVGFDLWTMDTAPIAEIVHGQVGASIKFTHIIVNGGVRIGCRTGHQEGVTLESSIATGYFVNPMLLIALPAENWKLVLSLELYKDFESVQYSSPGYSSIKYQREGGRLGFGLGFVPFGKV